MRKGRYAHRHPKSNNTDVSRRFLLLLFPYQKQERYNRNHGTDREVQICNQDYGRNPQRFLNHPNRPLLCKAVKCKDDCYRNPFHPNRRYEYKAYQDRDFLFSPFPRHAFQRLHKGICLYRLHHRILMQAESAKKSCDEERDSR